MKSAILLGLAMIAPLAASSRVDFALGVLAAKRGDAAEETKRLEKALAGDPGAFPLVARVASHRRAAGNLEGASTLYREFASAHPDRLGAQITYADFLRESSPGDDFAQKLARDVLLETRERFPSDGAVAQRLFRIHETLGEREKSTAIFESLALPRPVPGPAEALAAADMARTLFPRTDGKARATVDALLLDAFAEYPGHATLARAASEHFRTTARLPEAVDILRRHTEVEPTSLDLRVRLGILKFAAGNDEDGERTLKELLAIHPGHTQAHRALAKFYREHQRPVEAREHAAKVMKLRGGGADEFLELATEFLDAGHPREARLLLERARFDHPSDVEIAVKLAVATRQDPETRDRSSRLFREAETLSGPDGPSTDPAFLSEFAGCLLEAGQTKAAEDRLRAAIRAFKPDQPKETAAALRRLAGIWQAESRNEAAARALLQRAEGLERR